MYVFMSVCLSVCLSVRPSVCLSVCLYNDVCNQLFISLYIYNYIYTLSHPPKIKHPPETMIKTGEFTHIWDHRTGLFYIRGMGLHIRLLAVSAG